MHRSRNRNTYLLGLTLVLCGIISSLVPPGYAQQQPERITARAAAVAMADALRPAASAQPATASPQPLAAAAAATTARVSEAYGKLPMSFETNRGQTDRRVKFLSRGAGYTLFLTDREAVLSLSTPAAPNARRKLLYDASANHKARAAKAKSAVVRMRLMGASDAPQVEGQEPLSGTTNYFIGNDPQKWQSRVPTFGRVRYAGVYPGIDMIYYGNNRQLEYDFIVAPGANPQMIRLAYKGARRLKVDAGGDLVLGTAGGGEIKQHKPVIYQKMRGKRREVAGGYVLRDRHEVGFRVGEYDRSLPLVIDPVLVYSTYLGGSGPNGEAGLGIAVDSAGSAYITGNTGSGDFPLANPLQPIYGGFGDAFVTKLNAEGSALAYSTYLGGRNFDEAGLSIAVDSAGSVYVTGNTRSTDFPLANPLEGVR